MSKTSSCAAAVAVSAALLLATHCGSDDSGTSTDAPDGATGDTDATADGIGGDGPTGGPDGSTAGPCGASRCAADGRSLLVCLPDGGTETVPCAAGCATDAGAPACVTVVPAGALATVPLDQATATVALAESVTFNTADGSILPSLRSPGPALKNGIGFYDVSQGGGERSNVGAFTFRTLTIPAGITVSFVGRKPAAILVRDSLIIEGTLSIAANCTNNTPGVGGGAGGTLTGQNGLGPRGGGGGLYNPLSHCGGGGGGNATPGGNGGAVTSKCNAVAGGQAALDLLATGILSGGSGGGAGTAVGTYADNASRGGAGGGGLAIFVGGELVVKGTIDARGCGGKGPNWAGAQDHRGAGGGGSGGSIQIEAARLTIARSAKIVANGGGGGGSYAGEGDFGDYPGQDATLTSSVAVGGAGRGGSPPGGNGAAGATAATSAGDTGGAGASFASGGGGGAGGQIVFRALGGTVTTEGGALVSPVARTGSIRVK